MMKFRDMLQSRVEMNVTQYLNLYLSKHDRETFGDAIKVHVYFDGYYITQHPYNKFHLVIGNQDYEFETREEAEQFLWDDFLKTEINA